MKSWRFIGLLENLSKNACFIDFLEKEYSKTSVLLVLRCKILQKLVLLIYGKELPEN
jgi:hypothetical protein